MKWIPAAVIAALCVSAAAVSADTYVRTERHTDSYYRGGMVMPEDESVEEMWIGADRLALVTENHRILVNLADQVLVFVNLADSTFAETALPLDQSQLFSEPEHARLVMFKRLGTVAKGEEEKEVAGHACVGYDLHDWMVYDDSMLNERDLRMWVTTEVPFDLEAYHRMFAALEALSNLSDDYIQARRVIEGFGVLTEQTMYTEGVAIKTTIKVTDMSEKEPPADVYDVPAGWTKKELLTLQELNS